MSCPFEWNCFHQWVQWKWCHVISEARSWETMWFLPRLLGTFETEALDLSIRGLAPWCCSTGEAIWGLHGWRLSWACPSFQGCGPGSHLRSRCFPHSVLWVASNQLGFRQPGVETVFSHCALFQFLTYKPPRFTNGCLFQAPTLGCLVRRQQIPKQFSSNFSLFSKPSLLLPVLSTLPSPNLKLVILVSHSPLLNLY